MVGHLLELGRQAVGDERRDRSGGLVQAYPGRQQPVVDVQADPVVGRLGEVLQVAGGLDAALVPGAGGVMGQVPAAHHAAPGLLFEHRQGARQVGDVLDLVGLGGEVLGPVVGLDASGGPALGEDGALAGQDGEEIGHKRNAPAGPTRRVWDCHCPRDSRAVNRGGYIKSRCPIGTN